MGASWRNWDSNPIQEEIQKNESFSVSMLDFTVCILPFLRKFHNCLVVSKIIKTLQPQFQSSGLYYFLHCEIKLSSPPTPDSHSPTSSNPPNEPRMCQTRLYPMCLLAVNIFEVNTTSSKTKKNSSLPEYKSSSKGDTACQFRDGRHQGTLQRNLSQLIYSHTGTLLQFSALGKLNFFASFSKIYCLKMLPEPGF